jgi:late competence protein required for DNA uptake (superfamily II DNA/RNA helicase)
MEYYEPIDIWSEAKDGVFYCYTIFKRLNDKKYAVQSKDAYYLNSIDNCLKDFKHQRISLFIEEGIDERGIFADTIEAAILEFEHSFD